MGIDLEQILQFAQDWGKPVAHVLGGSAVGSVVGWLATRKSKNAVAFAEQTNAVTNRFNTLMDGYENRVADLMHEVAVLREEIASIHRQTSQRSESVNRVMNPQEFDYGENANTEADRDRP